MPQLSRLRVIVGFGILALAAGTWALAQQPGTPPAAAPVAGASQDAAPPPATPAPPPPPANAVAATVNSQAIPELAVYRVLYKTNPKNRDEARSEVLNFLVDTAVIDQYVAKFPSIVVDGKEIEEKIDQMRKEAKESGEDFDKIVKEMHLSLEELRDQLNKGLRWDRFCMTQATDKVLRDFFDKNKTMFDGSQVRARHILVAAKDKTPQAGETAKTKAADLKKVIDSTVAEELKKLPAQADPLAQEKERMKLVEKAFIESAKFSECPSKTDGGDVGWFPRTGQMVEPFARAAFALKPFQISDVVSTEFGYHLILALEHKQGKEQPFEDMKPAVMEVYCERLKDAILAREKPAAKIAISPAPK